MTISRRKLILLIFLQLLVIGPAQGEVVVVSRLNHEMAVSSASEVSQNKREYADKNCCDRSDSAFMGIYRCKKWKRIKPIDGHNDYDNPWVLGGFIVAFLTPFIIAGWWLLKYLWWRV